MHLVFLYKSLMHLYFVVLVALMRNLVAFFFDQSWFLPQKRTFLPFIVIKNTLFCRAETCLISGFCRRDIYHKCASRKWQMQKRELFCLHARRSSAWQNLTSFCGQSFGPAGPLNVRTHSSRSCRQLTSISLMLYSIPHFSFWSCDVNKPLVLLLHFCTSVNDGLHPFTRAANCFQVICEWVNDADATCSCDTLCVNLEMHLWEKRLSFCISGLPPRRPEPATCLETSSGTSLRRGITNFLIWSHQSDVAPCNINRPEVKHVEVLEGGFAALNCWFYVTCGPTFEVLRRKLFVNKLL